MNIILFDNKREDFYPLSLTRPIAEFRLGVLTIKEKWGSYFDSVSTFSIPVFKASPYPLLF